MYISYNDFRQSENSKELTKMLLFKEKNTSQKTNPFIDVTESDRIVSGQHIHVNKPYSIGEKTCPLKNKCQNQNKSHINVNIQNISYRSYCFDQVLVSSSNPPIRNTLNSLSDVERSGIYSLHQRKKHNKDATSHAKHHGIHTGYHDTPKMLHFTEKEKIQGIYVISQVCHHFFCLCQCEIFLTVSLAYVGWFYYPGVRLMCCLRG